VIQSNIFLNLNSSQQFRPSFLGIFYHFLGRLSYLMQSGTRKPQKKPWLAQRGISIAQTLNKFLDYVFTKNTQKLPF